MSNNGKKLCGAIKRNGEPCRNMAGHDTPHPGVGRCYSHEDTEIRKKYCYGKTASGGRCKLPPGYQTPHRGQGRCLHHEFPNHKKIWHKSLKLSGESCWCKESYEKWAMIELDRNGKIVRYTYEPFKIMYYLNGERTKYPPDILVEYSDGLKGLIEVKGIGEMNDSRCWAKNYAKFRASVEYGKAHNMLFYLWVYNQGEKQIWSFEKFCINIHKHSQKVLRLFKSGDEWPARATAAVAV